MRATGWKAHSLNAVELMHPLLSFETGRASSLKQLSSSTGKRKTLTSPWTSLVFLIRKTTSSPDSVELVSSNKAIELRPRLTVVVLKLTAYAVIGTRICDTFVNLAVNFTGTSPT